MADALPCIICGAKLKQATPSPINQPRDGTCFEARGHYGSTVYDPLMEGEYLTISICDKCLVAKAAEGAVKQVITERQASTYTVRSWSGPDQ